MPSQDNREEVRSVKTREEICAVTMREFPTITPARAHIDSEMTIDNAKNVMANWNPQREFADMHNQMYKCMENDPEAICLYMRTLHYLHEDLITLKRQTEPDSARNNNATGMASIPTNMSGKKTSNRRKKRAYEYTESDKKNKKK